MLPNPHFREGGDTLVEKKECDTLARLAIKGSWLRHIKPLVPSPFTFLKRKVYGA